ncbi:hypothetical protein HRD98_02755 [Enterococcus faecalis]|nr:hypothetical protein [Enterococcus faecalis]
MIPKFRAWDTYEKEMLENVTPLFDDSNSMMAIITDFQIKGSPGTSEIEIGSYDTTFNWDEFPYVIMQSTGLKDKNGVEIFEGDIVQYRDGEYSYLGIVKRDCYQFFIDGIEPDANYDFIDVSNTFDGTSSLEIIGNIHENPELLEGN